MFKEPTPKQGQYLAFIHYYTKVNGRAPAEADIQRHFQVTPPTVHQMSCLWKNADSSAEFLDKRGVCASC